jgi:hypothetical protein
MHVQSKVQVIQSLIVLSTPNRCYEVGSEVNGHIVIEIKHEDNFHSEYLVMDENGDLIVSVENCPVVVEYQQLAVEDGHYDLDTRTMTTN